MPRVIDLAAIALQVRRRPQMYICSEYGLHVGLLPDFKDGGMHRQLLGHDLRNTDVP